MRDYTIRRPANGAYQAWLDGDGRWYAIAPDGTIDDELKPGDTPQESRRLALDGVAHLNCERRRRIVHERIKAFLALPHESLPAADWVGIGGELDDLGDPWAFLRDWLLPADSRELNHFGQAVRLTADRDGWRDGIVIALD